MFRSHSSANFCLFKVTKNCFCFSLMNDAGGVGSMPTAAPPSATGIRKSWHEDITQDLRNHLVHKLYVANELVYPPNEDAVWSLKTVYFKSIFTALPAAALPVLPLMFFLFACKPTASRPSSRLQILLRSRTVEWRTWWPMPERWKETCTSPPTAE